MGYRFNQLSGKLELQIPGNEQIIKNEAKETSIH